MSNNLCEFSFPRFFFQSYFSSGSHDLFLGLESVGSPHIAGRMGNPPYPPRHILHNICRWNGNCRNSTIFPPGRCSHGPLCIWRSRSVSPSHLKVGAV